MWAGYANDDFSGFEAEPQVLFSAKYGSIDNDIIYKDGTWHLFYKGNTKDDEGRPLVDSQEYLIRKHQRRPNSHN